MLNLIAVLMFACVALALLGAGRMALLGRSEQAPVPVVMPRRESYLDRWERMSMQAGLNWRRTIYFALVGGGLALAAILALMGHGIAACLVAGAGLLAPDLVVRQARAARAQRFTQQLPGALFMASSVLRSGGTLLQAVDAIATEMPDPVGTEFRRIQQQMRLQVSAQEAFDEAQARVGIREFGAVVVATKITAEVGGNLAHIFDQISKSILEAENAQRTIKAFTTEGRMSANLIAALPFIVMGLLHYLSPGYFEPMYRTAGGLALLTLCTGSIVGGWLIIRRMVDIRMF